MGAKEGWFVLEEGIDRELLTKDDVFWFKEWSEGPAANSVHGARLQVDQHSSRNVLGLVALAVNKQ